MVQPDARSGKGYIWHEMSFFTRWFPGHCICFSVGTPDILQEGLEAVLSQKPDSLNFANPFVMHVPLVDQIVKLYDKAVWLVRDLIRNEELVRYVELRAVVNCSIE